MEIEHAAQPRNIWRPSRRAIGWLAVLAPLLALEVTTPWTPSAFPVWDYAEMLPLLRQTDGLSEAFQRLAAFTRLDGRANYLTYLQVAGTWVVSGEDPVGWQWQRAILMVLLGAMMAATVLRFRGPPLAAAAAGLIATLSVSATEGWLFLMGEPLASIALLAVALLMTVRTEGRVGPAVAVAVAIAALAVILAKEIVGLALPLALVIGAAWDREVGLDLRRVVRQPRVLVLLLLATAVLASVSVFAALRDAVPGAYATAFAPGIDALGRIPGLFLSMLLPAQFSSAGLGSLLYPANLLFLVGLAAAALCMDRHRDRAGVRFALLLLAVPAIGAVAYASWPRYSAFYGIPFALGGAGLLAGAIAVLLGTRTPAGRVGAVIMAVGVVGYSAVVAERTVADKRSIADLAAGVAQTVGRATSVDTVLLVKAGQGANRWPVTGAELGRYAAAIGIDSSAIPLFRDASCEEVLDRLQQPLGRVGILNDLNPCGALPEATVTFVATIPHRDWLTLSRVRDTVRIQLLLPTGEVP